MKILYDHQIFEQQKYGGISRYFCEVIEGLSGVRNIKMDVSLRYSKNEYLKKSMFSHKAHDDPGAYENFMPGREFKGKWSLYAARNKIIKPIKTNVVNKHMSIEALKRQDFDVFHPTYYDDYFLPYIGKKPFVLTIYDMINEIYPECSSLVDKIAENKRELAKIASKILTISECTKKDLINFLGISSEKISVIHLATSMGSAVSESAELSFGNQYQFVDC